MARPTILHAQEFIAPKSPLRTAAGAVIPVALNAAIFWLLVCSKPHSSFLPEPEAGLRTISMAIYTERQPPRASPQPRRADNAARNERQPRQPADLPTPNLPNLPIVLQPASGATPAPAITVVPESAPPAGAAGRFDMDSARKTAREVASSVGGDSKRNPATSTLSSKEAVSAFEKAARPKCDNNYEVSVGPVQLTGLLKLPALVKSALTDSGCKW